MRELNEHVDMHELVLLCQSVNQAFYAGKFDQVNQQLLDVTQNPTNITEMCAHLRYACCASRKLKDWKIIVNNAREQLIARDYDPNRILRGLDEST